MKKFLEFINFAPAAQYFVRVFRKDTEGKYPSSENIKIMHGINRISIVMFLIALVVMGVRYIIRH